MGIEGARAYCDEGRMSSHSEYYLVFSQTTCDYVYQSSTAAPHNLLVQWRLELESA